MKLTIFDFALNIVRNGLVVRYYSKPAVNLLKNFDRPLPSMRFPFKSSDVLDGKTDISQVKIGVGNVSEFENYEKMSYDSCVEIGACESACPATAAGQTTFAKSSCQGNQRSCGRKRGECRPVQRCEGGRALVVHSCGACVQECPVAVKHSTLSMIFGETWSIQANWTKTRPFASEPDAEPKSVWNRIRVLGQTGQENRELIHLPQTRKQSISTGSDAFHLLTAGTKYRKITRKDTKVRGRFIRNPRE